MADTKERPLPSSEEKVDDLESALPPTTVLSAEAQDLADKEQEKKALVPFLGILLCLFLAALDQTSTSNGAGGREEEDRAHRFPPPPCFPPVISHRHRTTLHRCRPERDAITVRPLTIGILIANNAHTSGPLSRRYSWVRRNELPRPPAAN